MVETNHLFDNEIVDVNNHKSQDVIFVSGMQLVTIEERIGEFPIVGQGASLASTRPYCRCMKMFDHKRDVGFKIPY